MRAFRYRTLEAKKRADKERRGKEKGRGVEDGTKIEIEMRMSNQPRPNHKGEYVDALLEAAAASDTWIFD